MLFDDKIPFGDEIRLNAGWVDLISSAKQISSAPADFILAKAVKILKLTDGMKGHCSLFNQLERSATSIGANIWEAKYAQSKADFVSKLKITLKNLALMQKAELLPEETVKGYLHDCGSIHRMLIASINTVKENTK